MNKLGLRTACAALVMAVMAITGQAVAQSQQKSSKKASIRADVPELKFQRNLFSGIEGRIGVMHSVNADCTGGPLPDIRIVTNPADGELRFDEIKFAVDRKPNDPRFHCNGKIVDAVGVFYKSRDGYAGSDNVVIEVDFRLGAVRRFNYSIQVR
jgi:hypothetical protein